MGDALVSYLCDQGKPKYEAYCADSQQQQLSPELTAQIGREQIHNRCHQTLQTNKLEKESEIRWIV